MIIRYRHRHLQFWFYSMEMAETAIQDGNLLQFAFFVINVETGDVVKDRHGPIETLDLVGRKGIIDYEDAKKPEEEATMTPASQAGLTVGKLYYSTEEPFTGQVQFTHDDSTHRPRFKMMAGEHQGSEVWLDVDNIREMRNMTHSNHCGFVVGDVLRATALAKPYFKEGELITLFRDDGSSIPQFQSLETGKRWYMSVGEEYVTKVNSGTPTTRAGITKGRTYRVKSGDHKGLEVVLQQDDGTEYPFFRVKESGNIYYINIDKIEEVDENEPTAPEAAQPETTEEESNMFDQMTPAKEHGLKVGDKVRVINGTTDTRVGEILTLNEDDGTSIPFFKNALGELVVTSLTRVEKYEEPESEVKVTIVEIGGPVQTGDLVIQTDGSRVIVDTDMDEPDNDGEYSVRSGYVNTSEIAQIVRIETQKDLEPVEVTIKLTPNEVRAVKKAWSDLASYEIDEDEYDIETRRAWVNILESLGQKV